LHANSHASDTVMEYTEPYTSAGERSDSVPQHKADLALCKRSSPVLKTVIQKIQL